MTASLATDIALDPVRRTADAARARQSVRPAHLSPGALAGVTLVHAGLFALLVALPDVPVPPTPTRPLTVSLIEAQPEPPVPVAAPSPPRPVARPARPQPVLSAQRPTPAPMEETVAPPVPETPVVHEPQPAPIPAPAPAVVEVAPPAPAPTPIPPRPADYLANPKPPYPTLSRRLGEEGLVHLNVLVNADGSVGRLDLARSSGHPRLDRSAMETVQSSWKFEPARQGGKAVPAWVIVPIQFTLRS